MEWAMIVPIAAIVVGPIAWVANNWVRARHGFDPQDVDGGKGTKQVAALTAQNELLKQQLAGLQQRMITMEAIVTDGGLQTAAQIEALRTQRNLPFGDKVQ